MLKPDAVPSVLAEYPVYLQPKPTRNRRSLKRNGTSASATCSDPRGSDAKKSRLDDVAGGASSHILESGTATEEVNVAAIDIADVPATDIVQCPQAPLPGPLLEELLEERVCQTEPEVSEERPSCHLMGEPASQAVFTKLPPCTPITALWALPATSPEACL